MRVPVFAIALSAICFLGALWWLLPSARCQSANTSIDNRQKDRIADVDETVPSKEELLRQRLNPEGNPAKENLVGRTLTIETEQLKELLEPLVEEEWQFLQQMPLSQRKPVPVVQPLKRRTPEEFLRYVHDEVAPELKTQGHWRPTFIALHNTEKPSLHDRPQGFTKQQIENLRSYYGVELGWKAGPAAFTDDYGIWIFNGFTTPGRHSPCWNWLSWGIEQLGDFDVDEYDSGRGAGVRDNAIAALAILSVSQGFDAKTLRFHKEDECTTHKHCPGQKCVKESVQNALARSILEWKKRWEELSPPGR